MKKYFLHGKLTAKQGEGEKLISLLLQSSTLLSGVKGCTLYAISQDDKQKDTVWITEIWDSKQDHDDSLKNEEIKKLIMQAMPLIDGLPEQGQQLEVIGGLGV